jgi:hypothetical protein
MEKVRKIEKKRKGKGDRNRPGDLATYDHFGSEGFNTSCSHVYCSLDLFSLKRYILSCKSDTNN